MIDIVLDMETGDPDDALSLCILATHPSVSLKAVTVSPGGRDQVGLIKHILRMVGKPEIPVGAGTPKKPDASFVSGFHHRWLGKITPEPPDGSAVEILTGANFRNAALLTGGPLTNILQAYEAWARPSHPKGRWPQFFAEWTCQGGFVGESLMPPGKVLEKFKGKETCPTWNLTGNVEAALTLLNSDWEYAPAIPIRRLVPKSVCHGVLYTQEMHSRIPSGAHPGLDLFKKGMECYFKCKPEGKALHDVLATALAIHTQIGTWVEVEPYRTPQGEWGCRKADTSQGIPLIGRVEPAPIFALIDVNLDGFERALAV